MFFNTAIKLFAFPEIAFFFPVATYGVYLIFPVFSFCVFLKNYFFLFSINTWIVVLLDFGKWYFQKMEKQVHQIVCNKDSETILVLGIMK